MPVSRKLTDDLILHSSESKDREIARAGMKLDQQQLTLMVALLIVAFAGIVVSFFDWPEYFPPGGRDVAGDARTGGREF